ncbi:helix-hairpin-helix domain-containing protein [Acrocarpospora catenulata]|uniref:helix-hairpin-helix domain-containing protein n=1 Tax=Acrocarpospora catenulata TaxID=2836182 RepID=UPI001BDB2569|nr:helix-hairpin-helix domain-containing protein [Acrocarpospora catenulata]
MNHPPRSAAGSFLWAFAPLVTCGFATPFTIGYAAAKRRSWWLGTAAVGYAAGMTAWLAIANTYDHPVPGFLASIMVIGLFGSWIGGTIHALLIRTLVFPCAVRPTPNEQVLEQAKYRRQLRQEARELARRDPALAKELRVGRPDLPRQYDDGGLIDINHVPGRVLGTVPGLTPELVARILDARTTALFTSAEELSITLDLPVDLNDELTEYSVYLP